MARTRVEILAREAGVVRQLRDDSGRTWLIFYQNPPEGAQWLGTMDGEGVWGAPDESGAGAPVDVAWLESPAFDEVGFPVGPDRDAFGIFDALTTGTGTGEHTQGSSSERDRGGGQRRTAVLAWIAAQDFGEEPIAVGAPCTQLKRLIADEPLDVVPALDGLPAPPTPAHPDAPEREDTATQIQGFDGRIDPPEAEAATQTDLVAPPAPEQAGRRLPSPRVMLLVALGVVITAWFLQFVR